MKTIDLSSDAGELAETIADGSAALLLRSLSSVHVSCGAHAGDPDTIRATLVLAKKNRLKIGAHPGYPDRENFGRKNLTLAPAAISALIEQQLRALVALAAELEITISQVKVHGALYNQAAEDRTIAAAIGDAVARVDPSWRLVGLAGSAMLEVFRNQGFAVLREAFIDRCYESDGKLRGRNHQDALILERPAALRQALSITCERRVQTVDGSWIPLEADSLCLHGDAPGAAELAADVRAGLERAGVRVTAPARLGA